MRNNEEHDADAYTSVRLSLSLSLRRWPSSSPSSTRPRNKRRASALNNLSSLLDCSLPTPSEAVAVAVASVSVSGGSQVSCIGPGLLLLVGIRDTDTRLEAEKLASKVANVRIWPSDDGSKPWHESVTKQGSQREVLCVSQFTLYGDVRKGNKPDWHHAMAPTQARELYDEFKAMLKKKLKLESDVKDGVFGAKMDVSLVNDGPITLFLEYENETEPSRHPSRPTGG
ncbi:D-tyrosyl-tRNA(Tyr) deacylase [Pycnococcus provasolii]|uniref:D-aminoacyl-tRNA deacylase n=1 Tax=Pycnococcus provasolii TaxID=41880 RepID=A0A830HX49_9CHLO|nr:D-tyrosyl-tRNA(Tyr) deacylase [Pycnococcus provasolii]